MKTQGRPKSRNIIDNTNTTFNGRRNQFINESMKIAVSNQRPTTRFGKQGSRKTNTGHKTGGGF